MVILGHNLGNSQVSVYRTIGPTLILTTQSTDFGYFLEMLHIETIPSQGVQRTWVYVGIFRMFEIKSFCFDVVMCDLVHGVRAIHGLC